MSAIGTKRTSPVALQMSAFGGKVDMTFCITGNMGLTSVHSAAFINSLLTLPDTKKATAITNRAEKTNHSQKNTSNVRQVASGKRQVEHDKGPPTRGKNAAPFLRRRFV
jgi:hypothetical protein